MESGRRSAGSRYTWLTAMVVAGVLLAVATAGAETGRVILKVTGEGSHAADAVVSVHTSSGESLGMQAGTNNAGIAVFALPAGPYKFCVKHHGDRIWSQVVHTLPGEETKVELVLEQLAADKTLDPHPVRFDGTPPEKEPVMLASLTNLSGILTQSTVATVNRDKLYWYINDNLGQPRMIIDENQEVVWEGYHVPFGDMTINVNTIENNFRFPGQYFDAESGLHYNFHRYYDRSLGRYITPDPLGLAGGTNLYAYGRLNPINLIDPLGLEALDSVMIRTIAPETNAVVSIGFACSVVGLDASREIVSTETFKKMETKDWKYSFSPNIIGASFFLQIEDRDATFWLNQKMTNLLGYWPDSDASATIGLSKHFGAGLSLSGKVNLNAGVFLPMWAFPIQPTLPREALEQRGCQ